MKKGNPFQKHGKSDAPKAPSPPAAKASKAEKRSKAVADKYGNLPIR